MKILFLHSGDREPSARFRVLPYVPRLRGLGHRCRAAGSFPQKYDHFPRLGFRPSQWLKRLVRRAHLWEARLRRYDVIVIDRELFNDDTSSLEEQFRRTAPALVLDIDDAVFLLFPEKIERLARMADLVIAGNRFLEERLAPFNSRIVVIPTSVDLDRFPPKPADAPANSPLVIGWMGTTSNLDYLQVVAPALQRIARRLDFELRLVAGDDAPLRKLDLAGVNVRFIPWRSETEVAELLRFDIGIMPLFANREWDRYKCPTKLLQYMAVETPGVASPVGMIVDVIQPGVNGFLAATTEEWEEHLARLAADPELRKRVGQAGRKTVAEHYSVEASFPKLLAALEAAHHAATAP